MSDTVNSVTKLSQTSIYQFFSPVTAEEARTANAEHGTTSQPNDSIPQPDAKQRGGKRFNSKRKGLNKEHAESTTAEVFESLDSGASKTEKFVSKYQSLIFSSLIIVTISVFVFLGYKTFILEPKKEDAITELNQAQYYFNLALNTEEQNDFFNYAINGGGGKFGFLDIIQNYENTPSSNLAVFSIGMSYFN